eukprot:28272-Pyramimonas_sp.AAC.1
MPRGPWCGEGGVSACSRTMRKRLGFGQSHMALDIQLPGSSWVLVSLSSPSATTWASAPLKEV